MDNLILWIPFLFIIARFTYVFYVDNIKRGAKISDDQLMQNYIMLTQKKNHKQYFPRMKVG